MSQGHILIVDDDVVDRKTAQRSLERAGWEGDIVQAANADDALALIRSGEFACILLDYRLPGQNGLELLEQLHQSGDTIPPIIMLTGEGNEMLAVESMKKGAFDYLPKQQLASDTLYRVIVQAMERAKMQRALAEAQTQLERLALYDALSGLGNRNLFLRDLGRSLSAAQRSQQSFCLLLMDLDRFKIADDLFGHDAGDFILAELGHRFLSLARASDSFYRLGGDEFTALIAAPDRSSLRPLTERIKAAVNTPFIYAGQAILIGISIGAAVFPADGSNADALIKAADSAMYRAKQSAGPASPADGDTA